MSGKNKTQHKGSHHHGSGGGGEIDVSKLFKELSLVPDEDDTSRINICDQILKQHPKDRDAIQHKSVALINQSQFEEVVVLITKAGLEQELAFELAYAHYRLSNVQEAQKVLSSVSSPSEEYALLNAQLEHKNENYAISSKALTDVVETKLNSHSEVDPEYYCNLLASSLYCGPSEIRNAQHLAENVESWDVYFNMACSLISNKRWNESLTLLNQCIELCKAQDDWDETQLKDELCSINVQKAFVFHQLGRLGEAKTLLQDVLQQKPSSVQAQAVAGNNLTALHKKQDLFDSMKRMKFATQASVEAKLTSRQRMVVRYNNAVLLMNMGKLDACRSAAESLIQNYPQSDLGPLLIASLSMKEGKMNKAEEVLKAYSKQNANSEASVRTQLALAQLQMRQNNISGAIQSLTEIYNVQAKLGVVATIVSLYKRINQTDAAMKTLDSFISSIDHSSSMSPEMKETTLGLLKEAGQFKFKEGRFQEAAETYLKALQISPNDASVLAGLVLALAKFDADAAEKYAAKLPSVVDMDTVNVLLRDPAALRDLPIPKIQVTKKQEAPTESKKRKLEIEGAAPAGGATAPTALEKKRERRREKKRRRRPKPKHMSGKPDPDRWLPFKERKAASKAKKDKQPQQQQQQQSSKGGSKAKGKGK